MAMKVKTDSGYVELRRSRGLFAGSEHKNKPKDILKPPPKLFDILFTTSTTVEVASDYTSIEDDIPF